MLSLLRVLCLMLGMVTLVAACSTTDAPNKMNAAAPVEQSGGGGGGYKVGEPYQVKGVWYYPNEDYSYDETGIASWYGPGFHGGKTANGERFDADELTAAHPTLPMPSLARVTNLDNGRSVVVRINDRGPFAGGRLLDVSRRAAQLLGFEKAGTAKVRLQVMADESKAIAAASSRYGRSQASRAYASNLLPAPRQTRPLPKRLPPVVLPYTPPLPEPEPLPVLAKTTTPPSSRLPEALPELPVVTQVAVKPDTHIYVQAGAFTIVARAEKLQKQLRPIAMCAINQAAVENTTFYRVRLGPFADVRQANKVLQQVAQAGVPEPRIIVD
jgi:rare lipoprotein A